MYSSEASEKEHIFKSQFESEVEMDQVRSETQVSWTNWKSQANTSQSKTNLKKWPRDFWKKRLLSCIVIYIIAWSWIQILQKFSPLFYYYHNLSYIVTWLSWFSLRLSTRTCDPGPWLRNDLESSPKSQTASHKSSLKSKTTNLDSSRKS